MTTTSTSSDLPPWASKLLLGVFVLGVVPVAIYGVYRQVVTANEVAPAIEQKLLVPYVEALSSEDYDQAHATFTSVAFRERVGLEVYRAAMRDNRERYGAPKGFVLHVCNETKEPGRPWFVDCEARYVGTKQEAFVSLEIVEHEGRYLIDRTFLRQSANDTRVEQAF